MSTLGRQRVRVSGSPVNFADDRARRVPAAGLAGFLLVLAYAGIEFVRPQSFIPLLGQLRPALILTLLICVYWVRAFGISEIYRDRLLVYFLLFTVMTIAWVPFATNTFWAYQAARTLALLLVAATVPIGIMLVSKQRRLQFVWFWMAVHAYLAVYSMTHAGRGPGSFLSDENDLAMALCMGISFPYFWAQRKHATTAMKVLCYALVLLILAGIVWTNSRGGFVGLVMVFAYMFWLSRSKIRNLIVIAILGLCALPFVPDSYIEEMRTIADRGDSTRNERLLSWRIGWDMFLDHPLVGVGGQNYAYWAGNYQMQLPDYRPGDRLLAGRAAHSLYFTLLPEYGIAGTALFGLIVVGMLRRLKASERRLVERSDQNLATESDIMIAKAIRASIIGYLTAGAFISVLYYPSIWYMLGLVIALSRGVDAADSDRPRGRPAQA